MNEIQSSEQLNELEILRKTEPTWKLANTEPFIRSAQQDVTPPDWDKSGFLNTNGVIQGQGGGGSTGVYRTWNVIVNGQAGYADFDSSVGRLTPSP